MSDRLAWVCEHGSTRPHKYDPQTGPIRVTKWAECPGPTRPADLIENPIWWCFEHDASVLGDHPFCDRQMFMISQGEQFPPCDIALATRPERIDSE